MIRKRLLLLLFQIKIYLKSIPVLLLSAAVFSLIVGAIGFAGNRRLNNAHTVINLKIAVVIQENDPTTNGMVEILENTNSISDMCSFTKLHDEKEALQLLENGEVAAVMIFPFDFYHVLDSGENTPVKIVIPDNPSVDSLYFCTTLSSGATTLANSESIMYAAYDAFSNTSSINRNKVYEGLYNHMLNNILGRSELFSISTLTATGNTSLQGFYIVTGIVLLITLCMIALIHTFKTYPVSLTDVLHQSKISVTYIRFCQIMGIAVMFFVLFCTAFIIAAKTVAGDYLTINAASVFTMLLIIIALSCYVLFFCCLGDSGLISSILVFFSMAFLMYAAGRIVPEAFLPGKISAFGQYSPFAYLCRTCEALLTGKINTKALLGVAAYSVFFFVSSSAITYFKWRKSR